MKFVLSVLLYLFLLSPLSRASQVVDGKTFDTFTSVRAMGMGNAYIGVVSDSDSLFYNPAGLARVSGFNWTIIDPWVGVSGIEAYEDLQDLQGSDTFEASVRELYGDSVWAGGGAKSAFSTPFFGVAVYDHLNASLSVNNPVYPNLDINAINDFGYVMGLGIPVLPALHIGLAAKYIQRTGSRVPFGPSFVGSLDPDAIQASVEKKGNGYGLDIGGNLVVPGPVEIVLSGVWRNVGEMKFEADSSTAEAPPGEPNEMALGAAINVDAPLVHITPAIDFRHLNRDDIQLGKKIHFGLEIGFPLIDVRAGFHQGYYSLGAGANLGVVRVDAATWGVELGDYPGQIEDRRYAIQATIELGFDPDNLSFIGGGSGGSGSGRSQSPFSRLKQRR